MAHCDYHPPPQEVELPPFRPPVQEVVVNPPLSTDDGFPDLDSSPEENSSSPGPINLNRRSSRVSKAVDLVARNLDTNLFLGVGLHKDQDD